MTSLSTVRRRANAGDAEAQFELGEMYRCGDSVPQDSVKAATWYRKAAEQGHAPAQFSLGRMYRRGEGVSQDMVEAAAWFRKAAEQGLENAQSELAKMYRRGEGVPQDDSQADAWWHKVYALQRAREQEKRKKSGEMESLLDWVDFPESLLRDVVVIRAFKEAYPTDGARRLKHLRERLREGDRPTDDEVAMLEDLIRNDGRLYVTFHGKGADYDDSDPSDVDLYAIEVRGLGDIYFVQAPEFGSSGFFYSLDDAESYVWDKWSGVDIFGPKEIRPPFGERKNVRRKKKKKKNIKKKVARSVTIRNQRQAADSSHEQDVVL